MASLGCKCGNVLRNTVFPNLLEGEIKGAYEYKHHNVWECDKCGRLFIDVKNDQGLTDSKSYTPDDEIVGNLFGIAGTEEFEKHLKENIEPHMKNVLMLKLFDRATEEISFLDSLLKLMDSQCSSGQLFIEIEKRIELIRKS